MRICMASDFFYPNMGGVEAHIFNLSQCLVKNGHKVILITHSYGDRKGIRYMSSGVKVYYLPIRTFYNQCILPTMMCNIPLLRYILIREQIEIVHGHSAFSALAHEVMFVGKLMGLRMVFTDHSLFGFADLSAVVTNKLLEITLSTVNHCICVSHTGKENTVLRAKVRKEKVSVIPNAVDTAFFTPKPIKRPSDIDQITIIIVSRLVYRKGVDLMAGVISKLANQKNINFIIAGDGPKRTLLEEVREKYNIQDRVTLLGALEHSKIREVLRSGHIFLNTSLTEAYCMSIVEAASCGLQVVSTCVGGVPEVLPPHLIHLTEATIDSLYDGLLQAIQKLQNERKTLDAHHMNGSTNDNSLNHMNNGLSKTDKKRTKVLCPYECNETLRKLYNWNDISERTERVYKRVSKEKDLPFGEKLNCYLSACIPFVLVVSFSYLFLKFLDLIEPRQNIDLVIESKYYASRQQRKRKKRV